MCVDTVLWRFEFDQVEAAVVHNAQALPEEDDFVTFHGQKEGL